MTSEQRGRSTTGTTFPSVADHQDLLRRQKNSTNGLDKNLLTADERWRWHAYDYGWRRTYIFDRRAASPIDPHGDWYDQGLADQAEAMYAQKLHLR